MRALRPAVEEVVSELLDAVDDLGRDGHPVDLRTHFTLPVPIRVISRMLGVPRDRAPSLDGAYGWDAVIEETLRWDAPVASFPFRYATCDLTLGGQHIEAGEPLLLLYQSFGRDPDRFGADADRFDPTRTATRHLTFGHGIHHCLGAPLAGLEAAVALPALFARHPHLQLAKATTGTRKLPSLVFNGFQDLYVTLTGR